MGWESFEEAQSERSADPYHYITHIIATSTSTTSTTGMIAKQIQTKLYMNWMERKTISADPDLQIRTNKNGRYDGLEKILTAYELGSGLIYKFVHSIDAPPPYRNPAISAKFCQRR